MLRRNNKFRYNSFFAYTSDRGLFVDNTRFTPALAGFFLARAQAQDKRMTDATAWHGRELYVALEEAEKIGASVVLGDRNQNITIKRTLDEKGKVCFPA